MAKFDQLVEAYNQVHEQTVTAAGQNIAVPNPDARNIPLDRTRQGFDTRGSWVNHKKSAGDGKWASTLLQRFINLRNFGDFARQDSVKVGSPGNVMTVDKLINFIKSPDFIRAYDAFKDPNQQ